RFMSCPWLSRNLLVLWDGEVCQCDGDMDNRYSCGNIYRQTLKEVWQGEMRRRRERHYAGDFDFEPCNVCKDWQVGLSRLYYPDEPHKPRVVDERE
ncbi:SPASM domain-containing protein, partial [Verrucomicrobiota bacterium]